MKLSLAYFWQNYCHACHTRFAVFVPLPSCCAISLISNLKTSGLTLSQFPPYLSFAEDTWAYNASVCIQRLFLVYLDWHDSVENGVRDTRMPKRTTGKRDISFNLDKHHMLHSSAKYPICFVLFCYLLFLSLSFCTDSAERKSDFVPLFSFAFFSLPPLPLFWAWHAG